MLYTVYCILNTVYQPSLVPSPTGKNTYVKFMPGLRAYINPRKKYILSTQDVCVSTHIVYWYSKNGKILQYS